MRLFDPHEFWVTGDLPGTTYPHAPGQPLCVPHGMTREVLFDADDLPVRMVTLTTAELDRALMLEAGHLHGGRVRRTLRLPEYAPVLVAQPYPMRHLPSPLRAYSVPEADALMEAFRGLDVERLSRAVASGILAERLANVLDKLTAARSKMMEKMA